MAGSHLGRSASSRVSGRGRVGGAFRHRGLIFLSSRDRAPPWRAAGAGSAGLTGTSCENLLSSCHSCQLAGGKRQDGHGGDCRRRTRQCTWPRKPPVIPSSVTLRPANGTAGSGSAETSSGAGHFELTNPIWIDTEGLMGIGPGPIGVRHGASGWHPAERIRWRARRAR